MIEVLFAVSIFSLVAVGGLTIMDQGANAAQRSLEITLAREQIDAQSEALRYLNASYVSSYQPGVVFNESTPAGQWQKMINYIINHSNVNFDTLDSSNKCRSPEQGWFFIDYQNAKFIDYTIGEGSMGLANTYAKVNYGMSPLTAEGTWIQAIRSSDVNKTGYVDFHIFACWESPGTSVPETIATIVRLYEPR